MPRCCFSRLLARCSCHACLSRYSITALKCTPSGDRCAFKRGHWGLLIQLQDVPDALEHDELTQRQAWYPTPAARQGGAALQVSRGNSNAASPPRRRWSQTPATLRHSARGSGGSCPAPADACPRAAGPALSCWALGLGQRALDPPSWAPGPGRQRQAHGLRRWAPELPPRGIQRQAVNPTLWAPQPRPCLAPAVGAHRLASLLLGPAKDLLQAHGLGLRSRRWNCVPPQQ